jgi:hypothetical protein
VGLCLALVGAPLACAPERDPVTANRVLAPGDETAVAQLTLDEEQEAIAAMRDVFAGMPAERPTPAGAGSVDGTAGGVRWSDVWISVYWSVAEVEMAILRVSESTDTRMVFELESALDEPARLIVEKVDSPERISATATVGTFGQREDVARTLEATFQRTLLAFGKKPGFD